MFYQYFTIKFEFLIQIRIYYNSKYICKKKKSKLVILKFTFETNIVCIHLFCIFCVIIVVLEEVNCILDL